MLAHLLRSQRAAGDRAPLLDLGDPLADQLRLDRLGVDLLHDPGRFVLGRGSDLLQLLLSVLEAGPDPLQVEHAKTAELIDQNSRVGTDHAVHCRRYKRQLKAVRTKVPADVYVVGIAGAARRNDRDVIESVGAPPLLASTDVDLQIDPPRKWVALNSQPTLPRGPPGAEPDDVTWSGSAPCRAPRPRRAAARPDDDRQCQRRSVGSTRRHRRRHRRGTA